MEAHNPFSQESLLQSYRRILVTPILKRSDKDVNQCMHFKIHVYREHVISFLLSNNQTMVTQGLERHVIC